jgi:tryptophan-rich sensory protein
LLYGSGAIIYSLTAIIPQFRAVATYAVPMSSLAGLLLIAYSLWVPEPEMARAAELAAGRAEVAA